MLNEYEVNVENFKMKIKNSVFVIFFLTHEFYKSKRFKREFSSAKARNKLIFFLLLEKFDNLDKGFKVIQFDEENKDQAIIILRSLLLRVLLVKNYNNENIDFRFLSIKLVDSQNFSLLQKPKVDLLSLNELIFERPLNGVKIVNFVRNSTVSEFNTNITERHFMNLICFIEHLQVFLVAGTNRDRDIFSLALFDKNGKFIRSIDSIEKTSAKLLKNLFYAKKSQKIFIEYENLDEIPILVKLKDSFQCDSLKNFKTGESILVFNDWIFTWYNYEDDDTSLQIYDLDFHSIGSIIFDSTISYVSSDLSHSNLLIIELSNKTVNILNVDNFLIISSIKHPFDFGIMLRDRIVFFKKRECSYLFFYKVNFNKNNIMIERKYICNLDPLKPHLYLNPYLLPCGNSGCLLCIYKHLNIYTGYIKCNFETCKEIHWDFNFKKDTLTTQIINENTVEIITSLMNSGNQLIYDKGKVLDRK